MNIKAGQIIPGSVIVLKVNQVKILEPKTGITGTVRGLFLFAPIHVSHGTITTIIGDGQRSYSIKSEETVIQIARLARVSLPAKSTVVRGRSID